MASRVRSALETVDRWQQRHTIPAALVATFKKAGDDRAGALVALLTYYSFLALFPMLLLFVTGVAFLVAHDDELRQRLLESAVADFPVVGSQLRHDVRAISGNGIAVVFGTVGALWGSLGFAHAAQHALDEIWNVPMVRRAGFLPRVGRGLALLALIGCSGVGGPWVAGVARLGPLIAAVVNVTAFLLAFRLLTDRFVRWRALVPGAAVAGVGWTVLQLGGTGLVTARLRDASDLYGSFAVVLGLLGWLALSAQLSVLAAELNVVVARRLWPRSLFPPPLTPSDRRVLVDLVEQQVRRPEQAVAARFDPSEPNGTEPDV